MSGSSMFRRTTTTSNEAAVLVTPPREKDSEGGVISIERDSYETVDVSDNTYSKSLGFLSFLGGRANRSGSDCNMKEMEDRTGTAARSRDCDGDFDTCKEYAYSGDEYDDDDDDDEYVGSSTPSLIDHPMTTSDENVLKTYVAGKVYHPINDYAARRDDESSLFWFTYRCDFPEIKPYNITSDAGWGCMLRSAQMMLGQTLRLHYKSRGWKPPHALSRRRQDPFMRSMMTWFADFASSTDCFYSLQNMVAAGLKYDKLPGEWFGPGTASYVLRDLVELHNRQQQVGKTKLERPLFRVHVASQGTVYLDDIDKLMTQDVRATQEEELQKKLSECQPAHPLDMTWDVELVEWNASQRAEWDTALLLLIPLRLGLKSFNEDYVKAVAHTFSMPQSVGVLGGRPRGARWFYGAVSDGSKIFGLDPHTVQSAPRRRAAKINGKASSAVELSDDYLRSVHTTYSEVFSLQKMDPSIAIGFYCRNRSDLDDVIARLRQWKEAYPKSPELFTVAEAVPDYSANVSSVDMMMNGSSMMDDHEEDRANEEDEYVLL